ncbi:MAG TPA: thiol reductant ABC exporter subunit CydC [Streptosporangiaceae bacterium]|nr:thiol reductant ABC exporter subunit CydC [Streptosporangiaceae bacterium]
MSAVAPPSAHRPHARRSLSRRPLARAPLARPQLARPQLTRDPLLRLLALARPMRWQLALAVAAGAAATGAAVTLLAVSGFLLARASQHPNIVAISIAVVAVRALGITRGFARYAERLASHDVAFRVLADVRVAIYSRLERLAPAGLAAFRSGDLLARLVSDVDATQDLFIRGMAPPAAAALVGAGATAAGLALLVPAGLLLGVGLLLAGVAAPLITAAVARRSAAAAAPARGELGSCFTDMLAGAAELHVFGAQAQALGKVADADRTLTRLARRSATASAVGTGLTTLAAGLTVWGVLVVGVAAVGAGTLGRVPLAVVTLTALAAFEAVNGLPGAAIQIGQARTSAARIAAVLDAPDPVTEPTAPRTAPTGPITVRLTGVSARYAPGAPLALDGVDLDLLPGRRVALVGPTGAGKSTVASVLLRFTDLASGTATLNGLPLADFAADDVRALIGGCPQDPYLFDTTIRENLKLARPGASDDELADATGRAMLMDWIASLPAGMDTPVGAHGVAVSGGERQRIALARALLADPALLILDEPTAHLPADQRLALTADLLAATAGRSTLLITHDPAGLEQVDEIVVLDHGTVAERGTHAQLLAAGGWYASMCGAEPGAALVTAARGGEGTRT